MIRSAARMQSQQPWARAGRRASRRTGRRAGYGAIASTVAALLFVSACSGGTPATTSGDAAGAGQAAARPGDRPVDPKYAAAVARIEQVIAHEMKDKGLPALSIALVSDQTILWSKGFGMADPDKKTPATAETVYRVGSVSKLFTDIAVMQLVETGQVDLDKPVTTYLPDFAPKNPFNTPITLRHLMSHRSGLVREPPVGHYFDDTAPTLEQTVASLNGTTLVYAPGTHAKYSNAGIAVVGRVVEVLTKQPFVDALQTRVLGPLGLKNSAFAPTPATSAALAKAYMWTYYGRQFEAPTFQLGMAPAGSMYATVDDLARFTSVLFRKGQGPNGTVIKPETLDAMWTPQFAPAGTKQGFGIGFGVGQFQGHRRVGHNGAIYGFATELAALPDDKLGVAVVTTLESANSVMSHITREALASLLAVQEGKPQPAVTFPQPLPPADVKALAGTYATAAGDRRIELEDRHGTLVGTIGGFQADVKADSAAPGDLIVDGRLSYGLKIRRGANDTLVVNDVSYAREDASKLPPAANPAWAGLIGEYGWDHNILYILERHGKLHALIEWFYLDPLESVGKQAGKDVFAFPKAGLYDGEQLVFTRDAKGQATEVIAAGVRFVRRPVGLSEGTFKITPLKPIAELRQIAASSQPPAETGKRDADLVELASLDPTIKYDIRYATTNNFMSTPFYQQARAFMQRPAAEAVRRAHQKLKAKGYGLLIHDAYRPWTVTKMFWEATPEPQRIFVADPSQGSRHNRGCAVDLTMYDLKTGEPVRTVGGYDEFSDRSFPNYVGGTSRQRWLRALLREAMEAEGFTVYEAEWWHFDFNEWKNYPILNVPFEQLATALKDGGKKDGAKKDAAKKSAAN